MSVPFVGDDGLQGSLRRQNLSRLLQEVHFDGPLSRSELGARIGINRSTVASLVAELTERGLVQERPPASRPAPGRPSLVVGPRNEGPFVLAMEIGTDSLAAAVVGLGGRIVASRRIEQSRIRRDPLGTIDEIVVIASGLVDESRSRERILAAGVSIPGLVRHRDGLVPVAPNLGWRDVPVAQLVHDRLGLDIAVLAGNDADLATLAEHRRGAGVGYRDFICLWGDAGMGAGIVAGGRQIVGRAGYAGEVGHMTVNPSGLECQCGSRGCWETEVGEEAMLRRTGRSGSASTRAELDDLLMAVGRGSPAESAVVESVGRWLGIGIASLVNTFDPSTVALGGLYARLYPYVLPEIRHEVAARVIGRTEPIVDIVAVSLGPNSALLGAAELAFAPTIADPTTVPLPALPTGSGRTSRRHQEGARHDQGGEPTGVQRTA